MKASKLTRRQIISVIKNSVIAGLSAFLVVIEMRGEISKPALTAATISAVVAIVKIVEKTFSDV